METSRHRRSRIASGLEGSLQFEKQKTVPKSHSYRSTFSNEDSLHSSLQRGSGTPIKKLLAEEMAKENETRRKQPSVIARLMGLDALPSPQHCNRQQRRLLEKHRQHNASVGSCLSEQSSDGRPSRRSSVDQQDFKDMYEDLEASHAMNHHCSSRWPAANSRVAKPEMDHLQQKFTAAKCLSISEEFQVSKELTDTLEFLNSSKELLLKYLKQPDSLFLKHLLDLQDDPSSSPYGWRASLEQSNSVEHQCYAKVWKLRDGSYIRDNRFCKKREDGLLLQPRNHHCLHNCCKESKNESNVKDDENILPTRIVVLKPNIVKKVNAVASVSSPESSHASLPSLRKRLQYASGTADMLSYRKKHSSRDTCLSKVNSGENGDIFKESTRQMGENSRSSSGLRGYAGDESTCGSDASSASELMTLSSRSSFDGNNWVEHSSLLSKSGSLVSKEAKKRVSERCKMPQKRQSMKPIAKGSTLGEMLLMPEGDSLYQHFDAAMVLDEASEKFTGTSDSSHWDSPLGISSKDGWKDRGIKTTSQERSLPPSSIGRKSQLRKDDLVKEKNKGKTKSRKGNLNKENAYAAKDDKLSNRKPSPCLRQCSDGGGSSPDVGSSQIQIDIDSLREIQRECNFVHTQASPNSCSFFTTDVHANAKTETLTSSFDSPTELCPKHGNSLKEDDDSYALNQEDLHLEEPALVKSEEDSASLECLGPERNPCDGSKESDHRSPVSVLEASLADDVSSSPDCFETVSAEINELRIKLQLLKMESGGCAETPVLFSTNEDVMQQQPEKFFGKKQTVGGESWKSSYLVDVLIWSGIEELDPDSLDFASWHSPECPIGPWVFSTLEKKYNVETTELQFERRLLFDRINSALLEMFKQHVGRTPWLQPMMIGAPKWQKNGVKDYLFKLLVHEEDKVNRDRPEILLDREMSWIGFGDIMDTIVKDVEKLLIDDLIGEVVAM